MQLGKYRLIRKLGKGGMGEVWEGALEGEHGFARRVAIERMAATGDGLSARFLDEARIASQLHHANIVPVLDFGVEGETWFQVLELIDGIDADAMLERMKDLGVKVPVELALHICAEVAHGLASAHAQSVVHRDVSPDNVLLSWAGDVKLSDFGVAKAKDRSHRTLAGSTVGKASYISPEQATAGDVDARTDVFALGCVLHALCTGATPLAQEDRLMELLAGKPLPLSPDLPKDVHAIVERAVQRARTERWQSAAEMGEALARARHARLSEDPKLALARFLMPLKPVAMPARRPGALDALLAPDAGSTTAISAVVATPQPELAPVRRPVAALVVTCAVVLALGAASVWKWSQRVAPHPAPLAPPAPLVEVPAEPKPDTEAAPPPPPSPAVAAVVAVAKPAPVKKEPAPKPTGTGVLAVGGAKAQRAEILVDGRSQGFAPKRLELGCGAHDVVLVTPQGEHIGPHHVEVTQLNTELEPVRWIVE